ncbi:PCYCGC motif-containing (lipo)protein [uncultured Thermanaerothrix sp.]|uniref:PCYCGC motif-containing (lipo)protein n=1 Tax=uncultured Thermanaerothrix sp. TaxID=1195149 RepID=UPI002603C362|nr:PCYCGC motif-containing (lipo)protein [uncultured Thermanaerothrix sp.]
MCFITTLSRQNLKTISLLFVAATVLIAACVTSTPSLPMAAPNEMPLEVQKAPVIVQDAYRFAVANPNILSQIPCYCGCGAIGHTSNYDCYVKEAQPSGVIEFDTHALGCSICVDITQDVMRLTREGKTLDEVQIFIDHTYAQYGPPTPLKP